MKKVITILMLAAAIILGGATMDAKSSSKKSSKAKTSSSASVSSDFAAVKSMVTKFYEGAVIGRKSISWTKSSLSKYCTSSFLNKMLRENEYDDGGYAVWILRNPDMTDSDPNDRVLSVEASSGNSVIVTYTDCGQVAKTRVDLKKVGGTWKINNCKFIS